MRAFKALSALKYYIIKNGARLIIKPLIQYGLSTKTTKKRIEAKEKNMVGGMQTNLLPPI